MLSLDDFPSKMIDPHEQPKVAELTHGHMAATWPFHTFSRQAVPLVAGAVAEIPAVREECLGSQIWEPSSLRHSSSQH